MKRFGWALFILLVIYFIFLIRQDIMDYFNLKKDEQRSAKKLVREESNQRVLISDLKEANTDRHIEKLARTKLGLIKKGENAYKVLVR